MGSRAVIDTIVDINMLNQQKEAIISIIKDLSSEIKSVPTVDFKITGDTAFSAILKAIEGIGEAQKTLTASTELAVTGIKKVTSALEEEAAKNIALLGIQKEQAELQKRITTNINDITASQLALAQAATNAANAQANANEQSKAALSLYLSLKEQYKGSADALKEIESRSGKASDEYKKQQLAVNALKDSIKEANDAMKDAKLVQSQADKDKGLADKDTARIDKEIAALKKKAAAEDAEIAKQEEIERNLEAHEKRQQAAYEQQLKFAQMQAEEERAANEALMRNSTNEADVARRAEQDADSAAQMVQNSIAKQEELNNSLKAEQDLLNEKKANLRSIEEEMQRYYALQSELGSGSPIKKAIRNLGTGEDSTKGLQSRVDKIDIDGLSSMYDKVSHSIKETEVAIDELNAKYEKQISTTAELEEREKEAINTLLKLSKTEKELAAMEAEDAAIEQQKAEAIKAEVVQRNAQRAAEERLDNTYLASNNNIANQTKSLRLLSDALNQTSEQLKILHQGGQVEGEDFERLSEQSVVLASSLDRLSKGSKSYNRELFVLEQTLQSLRVAGLQNTKVFQDLQDAVFAGRSDFNKYKQVKELLESPMPVLRATKDVVDGLSGAYMAAAGAAQIFGGDNEKLQKHLQQFMALTQIVIGIEQVYKLILEKNGIATLIVTGINKLFAKSKQDVAVATSEESMAEAVNAKAVSVNTKEKTANLAVTTSLATAEKELAGAELAAGEAAIAEESAVAVLSGGLGILIVGVMAAVAAYEWYNAAQEKSKKLNEENAKMTKEGNDAAGKELMTLKTLKDAAENHNLSQKERIKAAEILKEKYTDSFGHLSREQIMLGQSKGAYDKLSESILENARAMAVLDKDREDYGKILDLRQKKDDLRSKTINDYASAKGHTEVAAYSEFGGMVLAKQTDEQARNGVLKQYKSGLKELNEQEADLNKRIENRKKFATPEQKQRTTIDSFNTKDDKDKKGVKEATPNIDYGTKYEIESLKELERIQKRIRDDKYSEDEKRTIGAGAILGQDTGQKFLKERQDASNEAYKLELEISKKTMEKEQQDEDNRYRRMQKLKAEGKLSKEDEAKIEEAHWDTMKFIKLKYNNNIADIDAEKRSKDFQLTEDYNAVTKKELEDAMKEQRDIYEKYMKGIEDAKKDAKFRQEIGEDRIKEADYKDQYGIYEDYVNKKISKDKLEWELKKQALKEEAELIKLQKGALQEQLNQSNSIITGYDARIQALLTKSKSGSFNKEDQSELTDLRGKRSAESSSNQKLSTGIAELDLKGVENKAAQKDAKKQKIKEEIDKYEGYEKQLYSDITKLVDNRYDKELMRLKELEAAQNSVYENEKTRIQDSTIDAVTKAGMIRQLDAEHAAQTAKNAKEEKKIAHDKAVYDRNVAIAEIAIQTALAVAKAGGNPFLIALALAAGALAEAKAISTPIPAYAKGTDFHQGGAAIVGDAGTELITYPSGLMELTSSKPTVMNLPRGTKVTPHDELIEMSKNAHYSFVASVAGGGSDLSPLVSEFRESRNEMRAQTKYLKQLAGKQQKTSVVVNSSGSYDRYIDKAVRY